MAPETAVAMIHVRAHRRDNGHLLQHGMRQPQAELHFGR